MNPTGAPPPATFEERASAIDAFVRGHIAAGTFPGAVVLVSELGKTMLHRAWGDAVVEPRQVAMRPDTIFDVASLTKPLVTARLVLAAAEAGELELDSTLAGLLPEAAASPYAGATLAALLTHTSGLPAWHPLYVHGLRREDYRRAILALPPAYPWGSRVVYSCLGYILLGFILERQSGRRLDELAAARVFASFGLAATAFNPPPASQEGIAATESDDATERVMVAERKLCFNGFRDGPLWGTVNDGNAYHLGGVAGNAGLFSAAADLEAMARQWMTAPAGSLLAAATHSQTRGLEEERGWGWQMAATMDSAAGPALGGDAFGHTGFTGVSLWCDPVRQRVYAFLTNRIHPRNRPAAMNAVRRDFHTLAAAL